MSSETKKYDQLRQRMLTFQLMQTAHDVDDPKLCQLLEEVQSLFLEIEAEGIVLPQKGNFEQPFQG